MDMSTNSDNQSNLNCIYRLDAMPKSSWHDGWTMDGIRVPLNRQGRWTFTCHNSLCESDLYKEAVGKFNDFVAGLIHPFSGIGNPVWWYRGQANASGLSYPVYSQDTMPLNIVYFVPDTRKAGGAYMEISGRIKKLLPHEKLLIMDTGTRIPVDDIVNANIISR